MKTLLFATAQQEAYVHLREAILSGRYAGGSRLNLDEIARAVRASRMPVREAIRQLAVEGLVTITARAQASASRSLFINASASAGARPVSKARG